LAKREHHGDNEIGIYDFCKQQHEVKYLQTETSEGQHAEASVDAPYYVAQRNYRSYCRALVCTMQCWLVLQNTNLCYRVVRTTEHWCSYQGCVLLAGCLLLKGLLLLQGWLLQKVLAENNGLRRGGKKRIPKLPSPSGWPTCMAL